MSGWIAISRDLFSHDFFAREPMSEREAWVWMIANAAWKETRHRVGGEVIDVPRGSFFCTLRELQQAWGWGSDMRVRAFLKRLKNERMINASTAFKKTQITICNYDEFQGDERTENAGAIEKERTENALKEQDNNKQEIRKKDISVSLAVPAGKPEPKARLPADWALSDEGWAYARSKQIPDEDIRDEAVGFHAYWTDRGERKSARGWEQTWANRIRDIAGRYATRRGVAGKAGPGGYGQGGSIASIAARRRAEGAV